ncbi:MAG: transposase [Bacillota bacterium]
MRSSKRIIAEIVTTLKQFSTTNHLASWLRLVPRSNESAYKKKPHIYERGIFR